MRRLTAAAKQSKDTLCNASMKVISAYNDQHKHRSSYSDADVKLEEIDFDSDIGLASPIRKRQAKQAHTSSVESSRSSPTPPTTIFASSSVPNTPTKPRHTVVSGATSNISSTSASGPFGSATTISSVGAITNAAPSSYTLRGLSHKDPPLRRSPRKLTPQKRKRSTNENEAGEEDKSTTPSSPRSDVSATQDETQGVLSLSRLYVRLC